MDIREIIKNIKVMQGLIKEYEKINPELAQKCKKQVDELIKKIHQPFHPKFDGFPKLKEKDAISFQFISPDDFLKDMQKMQKDLNKSNHPNLFVEYNSFGNKKYRDVLTFTGLIIKPKEQRYEKIYTECPLISIRFSPEMETPVYFCFQLAYDQLLKIIELFKVLKDVYGKNSSPFIEINKKSIIITDQDNEGYTMLPIYTCEGFSKLYEEFAEYSPESSINNILLSVECDFNYLITLYKNILPIYKDSPDPSKELRLFFTKDFFMFGHAATVVYVKYDPSFINLNYTDKKILEEIDFPIAIGDLQKLQNTKNANKVIINFYDSSLLYKKESVANFENISYELVLTKDNQIVQTTNKSKVGYNRTYATRFLGLRKISEITNLFKIPKKTFFKILAKMKNEKVMLAFDSIQKEFLFTSFDPKDKNAKPTFALTKIPQDDFIGNGVFYLSKLDAPIIFLKSKFNIFKEINCNFLYFNYAGYNRILKIYDENENVFMLMSNFKISDALEKYLEKLGYNF